MAKTHGLVILASLLLPEMVLAAGPKGVHLLIMADACKFTGIQYIYIREVKKNNRYLI